MCYDFISDRGVRCLPQGQNRGKKKRIDLTLRKTLTPRSSESGFHRNVKFATFQEAGRLCKTIPQNGVKVAPLGGRSVPKLPHWLYIAKNFWRLVAQRVDFTEMWNLPHLKRLAGSVRPTIPQNGVKVAPLGGRRVLKFAPLTFNGVGRPMKWAVLSIENRFSIEHNSGSQCHRDKGAGSFDSDDQSASQDHCEAIKPRP